MSNRTPLWGYAAADAISVSGTRLSQIALPWLVLTTTGSASRAGLVALAQLLPLVLVQAVGGPWVDRAGPRRIAIGFDLLSALVVGMVPLAYAAGLLTFPLLVSLVAVAGLARGPSEVGHHAMIPGLVTHTGLPTERVTGLVGTTDRLASLTGAAVGGALVALLGAPTALTLDAASFALCAVLLAVTTRGMPEPAPTPPQKGVAPKQGAIAAYVQELREGMSFLRSDRLLLGLMLMVAVTNMLDQGYSAVALPFWAHATGAGPSAIGLLGACVGGSALLGSLMATWWGARLPRFRVYAVGYILAGAPRWVALALGLPLWLVALVNICAGLGSGFLNPVLSAVQFERIPSGLVGRVSAASLALAWSLMPWGGMIAGLAIGHAGLVGTLLTFAGIYFVTTMAPLLMPEWRRMDEREEVAPAAAA